ncbi:endonuclease/exonuclease/phosphatase family protein [Streptomyces sp. BI20]|uniref:endonuclease/exonuclease/phosphatase family protein n=1 Tax=Streptomyces sp. BI20 TaxID=3403460 RepID=UPI003C737EFB
MWAARAADRPAPAGSTRDGTLADLPPGGAEPDGSTVVRVLSWNLRSMRDDEDALARVIRACRPDVVLAQEAPRFFRWRKHAARLAAKADLVHLTGGATANGPLILCALRVTPERTEDVLLPHTPGRHRRGLATAVVRIGAARLALTSAHLSLYADERPEQAAAALRLPQAPPGTHRILAGDVNETPDGPVFRTLARTLRDCRAVTPWGEEHTFPAAAPVKRIDGIFADPGVEVLGCGVPRGLRGVTDADLRAATDHLPLLAALRLPAPGHDTAPTP